MKKFTYSEPFLYPSKADGYKDKKGIVITKWFIRYTITFLDGIKQVQHKIVRNMEHRTILNSIS